ncbi:MAG: type I glutamate--ammonia ligase, partial [Clostridia bacterium]|nr:type I glutamate--ammonia ligase [Clostridia bacterium]
LRVVKTIANRNGLYADFSPKPLSDHPGNGMHINVSVEGKDDVMLFPSMISGVLEKISDITVFLNPTDNSYARLGSCKAPGYITWSAENRSQLIRIPAATGSFRRMELRSADPGANPYLAFALLIYACLFGIRNHSELPIASDFNLFTASPEQLSVLKRLPSSRREAANTAISSTFVKEILPASLVRAFCKPS